jgi:hypothetical protein
MKWVSSKQTFALSLRLAGLLYCPQWWLRKWWAYTAIGQRQGAGWIVAIILHSRQDAKAAKRENKLVKTTVIFIDI